MKSQLNEVQRLQKIAGIIQEENNRMTAKDLRDGLSTYLNTNYEEIAKQFIPPGTSYVVKETNEGITFVINTSPLDKENPNYVRFDIVIKQSTGFIKSPDYFNDAKIAE